MIAPRSLARARRMTALAMILWAFAAAADPYPERSITLVVPFSAGGPTDVLARTLAVAMGKSLNASIVVENRSGAGGTIGAALVARAAPNGYTFLLHHNGMATAPALYPKLGYDPLKDFEYIGQVADVPMTLVARRDFAANNIQEFLANLRERKEKVNLAHSGPGAVSHLCAMLLQQALGTRMTTVAYQGTAPALTALVGGHIDVLCDQTTQTLPHIKAGRVKLYAVTTAQRIAKLPGTPTLGESGLKGFEVMVWHGLYAPKRTPKEIIDKVNAALRAALKDPMLRARLSELGAEVVPESKMTPKGLSEWLKAESAKWQPIIRRANAYAQ